MVSVKAALILSQSQKSKYLLVSKNFIQKKSNRSRFYTAQKYQGGHAITDFANMQYHKHDAKQGNLPFTAQKGPSKKDDPFVPKNYRPVSILPSLSKIYKRLLGNQLTAHFDKIFHTYLAAFRTSYGCQTTLLRIVEDWTEALDKNMFVGAILMDLSKAFECLLHDLIIQKLKAYGVSDSSFRLMANYLANRTQRGIIGSVVSSWAEIIRLLKAQFLGL